METLLGGLLFATIVIAHVAAVIAVHSSRRRQPEAFDAIERDPLARAVWHSGD